MLFLVFFFGLNVTKKWIGNKQMIERDFRRIFFLNQAKQNVCVCVWDRFAFLSYYIEFANKIVEVMIDFFIAIQINQMECNGNDH